MSVDAVSLGGGTNSFAMLIGMRDEGRIPDIILFADTGCERPHTYWYIENIIGPWCKRNGFPQPVTIVYRKRDGYAETLEQECLRLHNLPSAAYGPKKCSEKYKIRPQEKYLRNHPACVAAWKCGEKVNKLIGYDFGEERRASGADQYIFDEGHYTKEYWLIDHEWDREKCVEVIMEEVGVLPGKSSCFFCPNMKNDEIRQLHREHPDLFDRAVAIEENAADNLLYLKGLGRDWSWKDFIENDYNQTALCSMFSEMSMPCGCYDG